MFIFLGCILTNTLINITLSSKNFQKTNILYSGTQKIHPDDDKNCQQKGSDSSQTDPDR